MKSGRLMAVVVFLLSGCTLHTLPPPVSSPEQAWSEQRAQREAILSWTIQGKLGLNTPVKSGSANFDWRHTPASDVLDIRGPLGSGHARLNVSDSGAYLTDGTGKEYSGANAQNLLLKTLGWDIPVDGLQSWVRGVPLGDALFVYDLDEAGRMTKLIQDGWEIKYRGWTTANNLEMPEKIFMKTLPVTGHAYNPVNVRLVIRKWILQ